MARHSLISAAGTLLSRLLGFARDAAIAWLLGMTPLADALTTALRLPWLARRMYGEGTLSLDLTAVFTGWGHDLPLEKQATFIRAVIRKSALWSMILALAGIVLAGALVGIIAPGLVGHVLIYEQAVFLSRLCMPYIAFLLPAAVCMACLHSKGSFALPALMPSCFNVIILAFAGLAVLGMGTPAGMIAAGVVMGGSVQWAIQYFAVRKTLYAASSECPMFSDASFQAQAHAESKKIVRRFPGNVFFAAVPQCMFLIAACLTSFLPEGSLAGLFYAERLMEFPLGLLGATLGMAAAPHFAKIMAESGSRALGRQVRLTVGVSLAGTLPACAGLMAVALPVTDALFGHGAFDKQAVELTAMLVCAFAPGIPAYAASRPLLAACHVLQERRTLFFCAIISLGAAALCGIVLTVFLGPHAPLGPPLGASIGLWGYSLGLWRCVSARTREGISLDMSRLARGSVWIGASLLTYVVASACVVDGRPFYSLLVAVPAGAAIYVTVVGVFDPATRAWCIKMIRGLYTSGRQE